MDQRLFQAAWNGDVNHLLNEIQANPSMLHAAALEGGENPLHVACLAGHLTFVATVVNLRPQLCWELNQDGFSPLHIAASCGHVEIVKVLLQVDLDLCLLEGKDRKIPLHLSVAKGNVEVTKLLLSILESMDCTTAQGETVLHLAVKYNQFKVFEHLIQHLKQANKEDLLNCKDLNGNTCLHLAVYKKQYQVVDLILNGGIISKEKMELNSLNKSGLTPLDTLLMFQSEIGDREIHEILVQSGALKAKSLEHTQEQSPNLHDTRPNHHRSLAKELLDYFSYNKLNETPTEVRNTLLVIVILVAAATYQSTLSPPGGTWQDDFFPSTLNNSSSSATSNTNATLPHTAGKPIMLIYKPSIYGIFLFANMLAFYTSIHMIFTLTGGFPMRFELHVTVGALMLSHMAGLVVINLGPDSDIAHEVLCTILIVLMTTILLLRRFQDIFNIIRYHRQERV
ncbi:putative ankyrin repeat-containing domain, PGG domain, ankyrin repeat-containing domain superfamily [Helianthus annuus]|nr:putative ankyrin repeat-containing domain, PGG domain, ankyrin repeat-containing domain superfamily [Helianthus annuus]